MVTEIALSEFDDLIALADAMGDDGWAAPTRLEGWVVEDLCRHVASVGFQQGEGFYRGQLGIAEKPSWLEVPQTGRDLVGAMQVARDHLSGGLAAFGDRPEAPVPMPYADDPVPAFVAQAVLVLEYGTHASDLRHALDKGDELSDPSIQTLYPLLPALLDHLGGPPPASVTQPTLRAGDTTVSWNGSSWAPADDEPAMIIHGSDQAVTLFVLGRIPGDDPRLTITGDPDLFPACFGRL